MLKKLFVGVFDVLHPSALTCASKPFWLTLALFVSSVWMARRNADQGNQSYPTRGRLVSGLGLALLAFVFSGEVLAQTQIVNCDAQVQSRKRGIAVNSMSAADFEAVAPGVSWYYNWGTTPLAKPADVTMDFIPMAWNSSSDSQTSISSYLAAGNRPWRVFALNEPNLTTQANMNPSNSAITFKQVKAICDPYNIPVICPHMATGTAANQSITAYDPIQGAVVTYTSQEPFLDAFLYYCGSTRPTGMATHSYAGYGDLTYWTGLMNSDFPTQTVWVTEFNPSGISGGISSSAQVLANLIPSVDYCERTPWIEGYSWFMSRINGDPYDSLLSGSGVLTAAGQAYVQMPVHQTNLYYRIPGRLQAERYVTMNQMSIAPTTDTNGLADMITAAAGGSLNYNIQVDTAGSYPLNFRVSGATGQISVYEGGTLLGTANIPIASCSTVSTTVPLPAGTQTLEVVLSANGQHFNWMQFQPVNGPVAVPTGVSATAGNAQVALSWSPAAGATSYNVQSSTTQGGPYTSIATPTTTSYTNTGLANGTTYYYVVSATDGVNVSSNSIEVSATPVFSHANLALNQPVTASSYQASSPYCPAIYAVDGNLTTRWASVWTNIPQWIYVDLGATYNITEVELYWEAAYATSFQIQVSPDAATWTPIYSTTTGPGGVQDLTGLSGTGRYVRMYATKRATTYGYSLWEFQVYGSPVPTNQPPVLAAIPNQSILAGRTLLVTNLASDPNIPPLPLTFSLLTAPTNAAINSSSGLFTWRPTIAQSPSTQTVAVVVADNGVPPLTATQGFTITVIQPVVPVLNAVSITNGQFGFWINGNTGPDYTIQASTNLTSWNPVFTGNSLPLPYFWVDTNSLSYPFRFYRAVLGP
jgi:hypothetical protein